MDVELPRLADTLVEGTVVRWLKSAGDSVRKGEPLAEIDTDKVSSELEAPADGVLAEILVPAGETVEVGRVIARITIADEATVASREDAEPKLAPSSVSISQAPQPTTHRGLSPMRSRIAERMQEARATIPQGACVREFDASRVARGKAGWTACFVKALAVAADTSDIGVAVELSEGLIVPVVRGVIEMSLDEVEESIRDLAARARQAQLQPGEVTGAGLTVTNVGSVGTLMAFPLVVPGQPAILAPGAIRGGRCYVTLCYDRRRLDDYAADRLLARVEEQILRLR